MSAMKAKLAPLCCALSVLAQGACDEAKPRHTPPDPFATAPPQPAAAPSEGLSKGLAKRPELAGFSLDHIGAARDPLNRQPAETPGYLPTRLDGFGFDPVAKTPGKGVDVVVDGKAYGAAYGKPRQDVANNMNKRSLVHTGFTTTLPAEALPAGPHTAVVRVVAADGKGFFEGPPIRFEVK
jgi:hypothetical protein